MIINQAFNSFSKSIMPMLLVFCAATSTPAYAQAPELKEIRWKSESQVRALLGEPESIRGPIGTHASYKLWKYSDFTIAFANERVFHMFNKDSLTRFDINEKRS